MCGIVAYVGAQDAAGVAPAVRLCKRKGRIADLAAAVPARFRGGTGIGHTRWATHGEPSDVNAHPPLDGAGRFAVVHNGIIENAHDLRAKLEASGVAFLSETDSEVLVHLIAEQSAAGQ